MMDPIIAVFRLSLSLLIRSRRTMIIALLCLMPLAGAVLAATLIISNPRSDVTGTMVASFLMVQGYLYVLLVVVSLFYGTSLIADEIDDKTVTYLFMRPVPKWKIYLGKYLSYLVVAGTLLLPSAALTFMVTMMADAAGEASRHLPILFKDLGVLALGLAAYGALYQLLGAVTRRPVFVGLIFSLIWETFVTFIPGYLGKLTIKHHLLALVPHATAERGVTSFFEAATPVPVAILTLLLISAGLVALGAWAFTNREYVLEQ